MKTPTDDTFKSEIMGEPLALVMFSAPWAGPVNMVRPAFEAVAARFGNQITFADFVIDDNHKTPEKFGVKAVPTFYLLRKGVPVEIKTGAVAESVLVDLCEGILQ